MKPLLAIQLILSILMIGLVLLQQPSSNQSGGSEINRYHTKKGPEKFLFLFTILIAIMFLVSSLANVLIP